MNVRDGSPRLLSKFEIDKVLGSGAYGVVLQAKHLEDKKYYAIKVVAGNTEYALREVEHLVKIPSHPNVVHYHTCWEDEFTIGDLISIKRKLKIRSGDDLFSVPVGIRKLKVLCIQMELCGEDLRKWIGRQTSVDETHVTSMFTQIAKGLEHIHQQKIIHRDLKPDNIFLGKDDSSLIKIGDLGIAVEHLTTKSAAHTRRMGTILYLAPEQTSNKYGRPADVYALGLILFEMLNPRLQPPSNNGSFDPLTKCFIDLKYNNMLPSSNKIHWPKISELILKMVKVSPEDRPSFHEIYATFKAPEKKDIPKDKDLSRNLPNIKEKNEPKLREKFGAVNLGKPKKLTEEKETICPACLKPIEGGKITSAMGKSWHAEHFKCCHCLKELDQFFERNGNPYCEKDYHDLFSPNCAHCNKVIRTTVVKAMGKTWHKEHFLCAKCGKPVEGSFLTKDGKPYCQRDYIDLFVPKCEGCKKPIEGKCTTTEDPNASWHPHCFVCSECKQPLKKYYQRENNFYCSFHK